MSYGTLDTSPPLFQEHFLADFLNLLLLYGRLEEACASVIKAVDLAAREVIVKGAQVLLPYTAIDQLYYLVSTCDNTAIKKVSLVLPMYVSKPVDDACYICFRTSVG